jgi:hypothetical protein
MGKALWKPFKDRYQATEANLAAQEERIGHEVRFASESALRHERLAMALYRDESRQHLSKQVAMWDKEKDRQVQLDLQEQGTSQHSVPFDADQINHLVLKNANISDC